MPKDKAKTQPNPEGLQFDEEKLGNVIGKVLASSLEGLREDIQRIEAKLDGMRSDIQRVEAKLLVLTGAGESTRFLPPRNGPSGPA